MSHKPDYRIDPETGCWVWQKFITPSGYGRVGRNYRTVGAHRYYYELHVGPIPEGLEIDHLCRNRACVNPAHLEPVTHRENGLRGISPAAQNARKKHCLHGHELAGDNLYVTPIGRRHCRTCNRRHEQKRQQQNKREGMAVAC